MSVDANVTSTQKHRIVIIGSGFGGLFAARALKRRKDVEVTLAGSNDVLVISGEKTLEEERKDDEVHHVERSYAKIGVTNRIGASMYALRNGLTEPLV